MEAANKVRNKGDNSRMKAISDYLTHSQDVALKHYARTTTQEVKDARRAMNSLIHGHSSQGPAPANPNVVVVDDGSIPSTSTAAAMPSTSTSAPAVDSDSVSLASEASLVSETTSDTCVRKGGSEVEEAYIKAFPPSARTAPALIAVRKWLKATNVTSQSEEHPLAKRLLAFWRRQHETYDLRQFLSVNNERPSTRDEAIQLMKKLNLRNITHSR